ncbi:hypothetical protein [Paenibacillus sp. OV219]|uniref:hypothetical protein n=1 Tax=Paenibacillus sp. OV219 TaxID=1884377 RepID=UPI0008D02A99|nr:hypothetical protein [Paenibacillus sp. OV219]SEM81345.1 hypothetical protein SAMN05518847_101870 [Paenibacillus sp. OV219]
MKTEVKLLDGAVIEIDEQSANKLMSKIHQSVNASQVTVIVNDTGGVTYFLPFSSVLYVRTLEEELAEEAPMASEATTTPDIDMTIEQLKEALVSAPDVEAVQHFLTYEQSKEKPRKSAVEMLEAKLVELTTGT